MRSLFLFLATAAAYGFLRGWPEALHPLLRACFAVLVIVLGFGLWNRRSKPGQTVARAARRPGAIDYLAMGLAVLAFECFFLFFLTAAPPHAESLALTLEARLRPEAAAARKAELDAAAVAGGPRRGNWLWNSIESRSLPMRFSARPSNKPEVFLWPDPADPPNALGTSNRYVCAFALDDYRDAAWIPHPIPTEILTARADEPISLPQPSKRPGTRFGHRIAHADNGHLAALQGVEAAFVPKVYRTAPGVLRIDPPPESRSGYDYDCVSRPLHFDDLLASPSFAGINPSTTAPEYLLALPDDQGLRDNINEIAALTQGPLEDRLKDLRNTLHKICTYSLEISNPRQLDPLENFLFHERRGHCEFFAMAGAFLVRALGVPSRVAYGWTGGRWFESQGYFIFHGTEAHAWTEIYLENIGWVIFDTTPPGALAAASASVPPAGDSTPTPEDAFPENDADGSLAALGPWPWVAFGAGGALLPLAFLVLHLRRRPAPASNPDAARLLPNDPRYLARFKRATAGHGHPMPAARTLRQHLQHLRKQDLAPDFSNDLLDYHYAITYAETPPDPGREKLLARAIREWTA